MPTVAAGLGRSLGPEELGGGGRAEGALQGPSGWSRGFSDSSENSLSLLPLLLNLSQDASVLLSKSIEGKAALVCLGFHRNTSRVGGRGAKLTRGFLPSAPVGCLMAGILALGVVPVTQCSLHRDRASVRILTVRGTITVSAFPRNQSLVQQISL